MSLAGTGGTWSSPGTRQWLQIDLISQYTIVTGVATKGTKNENSKWMLITYKLKYCDNGANFQYYKNHTTNTTVEGQVKFRFLFLLWVIE